MLSTLQWGQEHDVGHFIVLDCSRGRTMGNPGNKLDCSNRNGFWSCVSSSLDSLFPLASLPRDTMSMRVCGCVRDWPDVHVNDRLRDMLQSSMANDPFWRGVACFVRCWLSDHRRCWAVRPSRTTVRRRNATEYTLYSVLLAVLYSN